VEAAVRRINADAQLLRTLRSAAPLAALFHCGTLAAGGRGRRGLPAPPPPAFARGAERLAASAAHDARVSTVYIELPGCTLDEPRFRAWLEALLWEPATSSCRAPGAPPPLVLRCKAVLRTAGDGARPRVLQGVRETYEVTEGAAALAAAGAASRLVFIGRGLEAARMRASLLAECTCAPEEDGPSLHPS